MNDKSKVALEELVGVTEQLLLDTSELADDGFLEYNVSESGVYNALLELGNYNGECLIVDIDEDGCQAWYKDMRHYLWYQFDSEGDLIGWFFSGRYMLEAIEDIFKAFGSSIKEIKL